MSKIVPSGFEAAFLASWDGWDEINTAVFGFYSPVFKDEVRSKYPAVDEIDFVVFDLNKMILEGYCEEDVLLTINIKLVEV